MSKKILVNVFIYIIVIFCIINIVGKILVYFYGISNNVNKEVTAFSNQTILNLYLLKTVESKNVKIKSYGLINNDSSDYYITFLKEDGSTNTFVKLKDIIYFNNIKLCDNMQEFKVIVDKSEKEKISVEIKSFDRVYNLQYVLNN